MKKYELLLVLPGTLDEAESTTRSGEILKLVKEFSEDADLEVLGKNRLAYPVKQIRYGYFYTIIFSAEPSQLKSLQEKLVLERDLLRALISYFNAKTSANKKIVYSLNDTGVVTIEDKEEKAPEKKVSVSSKIDFEDINKKLDEILDSDSVTGV